MKLKNFHDLIQQRFDKNEIVTFKQHAEREAMALQSLQASIIKVIDDFMKKNDISFNEMAKWLHSSPSQFLKIQNGKANLTLASLAHLATLLGQEPILMFKNSK